MAFDAFLKIETIPGESTDSKHKDWIEILSYSHGVSQTPSGSLSSGGGASSQRCDHAPMTITKALDKSSPKLAEACCKGDHISEVIVSLNRAGGDKEQYMQYKLMDVLITDVSPSGAAKGNETLPLETVSFVYGQIEWTYTQQKLADGTAGGKVASGWDLRENKAL